MKLQTLSLNNSYSAFQNNNLGIEPDALSPKWVNEEQLWKVCVLFLLSNNNDKKISNPKTLASLVNRLKNQEVRVGGPYTDNDDFDLMTNVFIYQIMCIYKIELPELRNYLISQISKLESLPAINISEKWFFSWAESVKKPTPDIHYKVPLKKYFPDISNELSLKATRLLEKIYQYDTSGEIRGFSSIFYKSLNIRNAIDSSTLEKLDRANVYAWMAYIVYDDILDDNEHQELLPLANISQRKAYSSYLELAKKFNIPSNFISNTFDTVDSSLELELSTKQSYFDSVDIDDAYVSNKSLGHILGPMIIIRTQYDEDVINQIDTALKNYLIAKQLCDDIKDFDQDLKMGIMTFPIKLTLERIRQFKTTKDGSDPIEDIRNAYWEHGLEDTARYALEKVNQSASELEKICNQNSDLYKMVLNPIASSLKDIIKHHLEKKEFLETYTKEQ